MQPNLSSPKQITPIFNDRIEILKSVGEGNTAKVYLGRDILTNQFCALKIMKEEFLNRSPDSIL